MERLVSSCSQCNFVGVRFCFVCLTDVDSDIVPKSSEITSLHCTMDFHWKVTVDIGKKMHK